MHVLAPFGATPRCEYTTLSGRVVVIAESSVRGSHAKHGGGIVRVAGCPASACLTNPHVLSNILPIIRRWHGRRPSLADSPARQGTTREELAYGPRSGASTARARRGACADP